MQTETGKSSYLNIRISELSKTVIQRAAALEGETISHFVISQALEKAYQRLAENQTVSLSQEDQLKFFQLLEDQTPLNGKLSTAIERYKRVKENESEV